MASTSPEGTTENSEAEETEEYLGEEDEEEEDTEESRLHALTEEAKEEVRSQLREMKALYRSIIQRCKQR
jgi:hypothetical protein